jgi:hypothetical protein
MNEKEEDFTGIKSLVEAGSSIGGPATGAGIGFLLGGPTGAAAGAGASYLIQQAIIKIGNDVGKRFLSEREKMRIGGVTLYAWKKVQKKRASGENLRDDDGFFEQPQTYTACVEIPIIERPPAEETFEGVLLAVQREHEEKKLPFIGNLMANICFDRSIDKAQINLLIKLSEIISYRQLCILSIFAQHELFDLKKESYRGITTLGEKRISLLQEIADLYAQGLLNCSGEALLGLSGVNPSKMRIQGTGAMLYKLMELWNIDKDDLEPIINLLQ